jgi:hypothetical protein
MHSLYLVLAIGNTVMMCMFAAAYIEKVRAQYGVGEHTDP